MKVLRQILPAERVLGCKVPVDMPVESLVQSTALLKRGSVFFAIKGSKSDGHLFVPEVVAKGAVAVVESRAVFEANPRTILVESTRRVLGEAASAWFDNPTLSLELVGITGTNGKTTSSFLLNEIWRAQGRVSGVVGTVEYRMGDRVLEAPLTTPDALTLQDLFSQMRGCGVSSAAIEVSSIALEQSRVAGCRFEVGLFTNFTPDHLDYHGSMERYLAAKQLFFTEFAPRTGIFNIDDPAVRQTSALSRTARSLTYSTQESADFCVKSKDINACGIRAELETPLGAFAFRSPLLGVHNLSNCLGVLATEYALGHDLGVAVETLATAVGAPGRLERVAESQGRPHVFVDYAHTEDALRNVLLSLQRVRETEGGKIFTVFGCGGDRDRSKRSRMGAVVAELSDKAIATSDNPRTEDPDSILDDIEKGIPTQAQYHRESDRRSAIRLALTLAEPGDFVLIAGKGHENYQILGTEKVPFDDRQVVRDYYGIS